MTQSELDEAEDLLKAIQAESPTIKRLITEGYYEFGENYIVFQRLDKHWKLEIKVVKTTKKHQLMNDKVTLPDFVCILFFSASICLSYFWYDWKLSLIMGLAYIGTLIMVIVWKLKS